MATTALINPPNCHLCGSRVFKIRLDGRLAWRVRDGKITPPEINIILPRVSVHNLVCFNCGNDFIHATTAPYALPQAEPESFSIEPPKGIINGIRGTPPYRQRIY